ncbi:beta-amyrin 28-monooxygenase-like [Pistacia vera]|uniref:beta-amyrin 28-monooxygenase-like n=1 Tax=Pistacia vera TaxID=55513 RepID=UPI001263167D|nr:beta-amyrin 28-monooxygenase-like [Pistacia vera]
MVFMCSPEANKFMFANENKLLKPWWPRNIGKIFEVLDKLSESKKHELASMRKNVSTLFNQLDAMQKNVGIIDSIARKHLQTHWIDCKEVVAHSLAKKYTLTISFRLMLNVQDSATVEELEKLFNCIMSGMFALPINIPGTKFNRAIKASRGIRKKIEEIVRKRKIEILENIDKSLDSSKDLLSLLILEKIKENEEVIESEIANMILVYIVAAYDSTSTTIASTVKYLAELPQVYEEVRREQMKIANCRGQEEALNLEDIKKMSYSWNVVSEVLRLQPTSWTFQRGHYRLSFDGF